MLTAEEVTMQEMEDTIDCQEQLEQGRFLDVGSNYMALAGISHEEMWEEAASLGFVAALVNAADEGYYIHRVWSTCCSQWGLFS